MSGEHQLPPGIGPGAPDVDADPGGAEARGHAMVNQAASAILDGVARELPGWVTRQVARLLDAWGSDGTERPVLPMYWFALDRHFDTLRTLDDSGGARRAGGGAPPRQR